MLKPPNVGRNKFERYFIEQGYGVKKVKRYYITTRRGGNYKRFTNLMRDKKIRGINQVWVSDITYYKISDKFYYIVLIMDVYSRRIIGYDASGNLYAESSYRALKMAIKARKIGQDSKGLIHHSDKGSQFMSDLL